MSRPHEMGGARGGRARFARAGALLALLALAVGGCSSDDGGRDAAIADTADTSAPDTTSSALLVADPERIDFPVTTVGVPLIADLELENVGEEPIVVDRIAFVSGDGELGTNLLETTVGPGAKVVVKVTFYALTAGTHADTLRVRSNARNGPVLDVPVLAIANVGVCEDLDGDQHGVGCAAGADCDEDDDAIYAGAPERCNGEDDNCNNLYDESFVGLGEPCSVGLGRCARDGHRVCADDGAGTRCDTEPAPGAAELCNGEDDDCDGLTDEDFPSKGGLCSVGLGACRVVDKYVCAPTLGGLTCPVTARPPSTEVCDDGVDNDCDGVVDEGQIEVCGNRVDDDCDGQTDESGSRWGEVFFARDQGDTVAVYPSSGDGTFEPPIVLDFPGDARYSVLAVADIDGDRWLDLLVRETVLAGRQRCLTASQCGAGYTCAEGICRRLCTNDGQCNEFPLERCVDTRSHPVSQDTYCVPPAKVYLARSSCTGAQSIELTELFTLDPGDVAGPVLDVDGNGHVDLVGLHHWAEGKRGFVWLNDGHGGYTRVSPAFDYGPLFGPGVLGHWQWGLSPSGKDLDGDGYVDVIGQSVASTDATTTGFWYLRSRGDGTFDPMVALGADIPSPANLTAVGDFDGDGDQDIVGGLDEDGQPGAAWILLNLGGSPLPAWVAAYEVFDLVPT
ncbi:MAG: VCBS repeat-containing protein, partial [Myxococcales bacterium]|nr:VCBS repeat-containing protein [Myxococcales bacterium]